MSHLQRASLASNRRRHRRIHSSRLRRIIKSANAVHRVRAWATSGAFPSTDAQPGQKAGERCWKPDISREQNAFIECSQARRLRAAIWNRPAEDIESISRDFGAACEGQPTARAPKRHSRQISGRRANEKCRRSAGAPQWPWRNLNLPLAAGPRVRHIRAHGAVAEWLKAAVC